MNPNFKHLFLEAVKSKNKQPGEYDELRFDPKFVARVNNEFSSWMKANGIISKPSKPVKFTKSSFSNGHKIYLVDEKKLDREFQTSLKEIRKITDKQLSGTAKVFLFNSMAGFKVDARVTITFDLSVEDDEGKKHYLRDSHGAWTLEHRLGSLMD